MTKLERVLGSETVAAEAIAHNEKLQKRLGVTADEVLGNRKARFV